MSRSAETRLRTFTGTLENRKIIHSNGGTPVNLVWPFPSWFKLEGKIGITASVGVRKTKLSDGWVKSAEQVVILMEHARPEMLRCYSGIWEGKVSLHLGFSILEIGESANELQEMFLTLFENGRVEYTRSGYKFEIQILRERRRQHLENKRLEFMKRDARVFQKEIKVD